MTEKITASGAITKARSGSLYFWGVILGTDGTNDPAITIYNNTSAAGEEIMPTTTFDASALGLNGFMAPERIYCDKGIYVEITCAGDVEVVVLFS